MDQRAQSIVWSSMQRILHGCVQQDETTVPAGDRGYAALVCSGCSPSAFCQECTAGPQVTGRHFYLTALCKKRAIASPWIGCSSSARSHLVRNTFRLLQGIAALHLQFRCMIQIPVRYRCRRPGEASSVAYRLLAQTPTHPAHAAAFQSGLCGLFPPRV